jgi:Family of unknown function (DUF5455)
MIVFLPAVAAASSIVGVIGRFLIGLFAAKVVIKTAAVGVFIGLLYAFIATINGLFQSIQYAMPQAVSMAYGWVMPSNTVACVSAIMAGYTARWIFDASVKILFARLS